MTDPVLSVNLMIAIRLIGVIWCIYYILTLDKNEEKNSSDFYSSTPLDE